MLMHFTQSMEKLKLNINAETGKKPLQYATKRTSCKSWVKI